MSLLDAPLARIAAAVRAEPELGARLAAEARRRIAARPELGAVVELVATPGPPPTGGALAGVPTLLKDLQADAADLPLRRGSRALADARPVGDSTLVRRLRSAGAVILGRTNTPEFGLGITTEPAQWGPVRNPLDPGRSAGGSSGGAAAAVAAGLVPFAHATDSGGSTRIPAAWCGVVGFKPSRGVNPAGPHRLDDWFGLSHEHAITRTVADTRLVLAVTAGAAPGEWLPCPTPAAPEPGAARIGVLTAAPAGDAVHPAWAAAADAAAGALADQGHDVRALAPAVEAERIGPLFGAIAGAHLARLVPPDRDALLEPAVREVVERGRALRATDLVGALHDLHRLAFDLAARFADVDVVLSPTTAWPAPPLGTVTTQRPAAELFGEIFRLSPFVAMFNVTGGPGISIPWGRDGEGMPVGVHLGAAPGRDGPVLALAESLEAAPRRPGRPGRSPG
ncbi:amidase [Cryptosporangium japonicum]|uniref:Amidase n=1 Tax=Cryptosporangium japonicum TaxID=80872 RepID=A0ABN0UJ99_9ACTN